MLEKRRVRERERERERDIALHLMDKYMSIRYNILDKFNYKKIYVMQRWSIIIIIITVGVV